MGRAYAIAAIFVVATGCKAARPQLVVTLAADLPLPADIRADDTLSAATAIDQIHIAALGDDLRVTDERQFVQTPPFSFGVVPAPSGLVRLRITAFRASLGNGLPLPGTAIDRLFIANVATVENLELVLHGDCIGRPADPIAGTTCLDGVRLSAPAQTDPDTARTLWPPARATPCTGATPSNMVCIRGGASVVGDAELDTVDATSDLIAAPPRMVVLSPFFMDTLEFTVAQLRPLVSSGQVPAPSTASGCNYTTTVGPTDNEAVRCIPFATARDACIARGGHLPTAAQWEHAARGRGQETRYPWGDTPPTCDTAALASGFGCSPSRMVGSHDGDTSRDGVRDLGGSVREWVLDAPQDFDSCLGRGVLMDPTCAGSTGSTKGGSLDTPLEGALTAPRRAAATGADIGFRCVR